MNVLIVGAGAVGSVYGWMAQRGGANVSFFVRPNHVERLQKGLSLYEWKFGRKKPKHIEFQGFSLCTTPEQVKQQIWDLVILTVPSNALDGEWLKPFLEAIQWSPVLALQPGTSDKQKILSLGVIRPDQLVMGGIPIISYLTPLRNEALPSGAYAFLLPPGAKMPLEGSEDRTGPISRLFAEGGMGCQTVQHAGTLQIVPATLLSVLVAALKKNHWKFSRLFESPDLKVLGEAAQEGIAIAAKILQAEDPAHGVFIKVLLKPFTLKHSLKLGKLLFPFDLEHYLEVHFTKVGVQMSQGLEELIEGGKKFGLKTKALEALNQ